MTKKFINMCELYKIFGKEWDCDWSEDAMVEMFEYESLGKGDLSITGFNVTGKKPNGYAVGKKWLNVNVSMWREEMLKSKHRRDYLTQELFNDPKYKNHHEWLIDVLGLREAVNKLEQEIKNIIKETPELCQK